MNARNTVGSIRSATLFFVLAMAWFVIGPSARAQTPTWTRFNPTYNRDIVSAYDAERHEVVAFVSDFVYNIAQTWVWDGVSWTQRLVAGPPTSDGGPAMVYDSVRHVTVLVGNRQTWEWDGLAWTLRSSTGPAYRRYHSMAFDPVRGVTVLFGGYYNPSENYYPSFSDTWEWNGTTWTQRSVSGPSARSGSGMAYDFSRNVVVLFGGVDRQTYQTNSETWEWNGVSWTLRSAVAPPASGLSMAFDPDLHAIVGFRGSYPNGAEMWTWNGTTWTQVAVTGPVPYYGGSMAYDQARRELVLVNRGGGTHLETWTWNGAWTRRMTSPPDMRKGAMAYDSARHTLVLFGSGSPPNYTDVYTWEREGPTWVPRAPAVHPSARYNHFMAYDSRRGVTVLFGGNPDGIFSGETWEWDGNNWALRSAPGPSPRIGAAMAYDAARGKVVLFGGQTSLVPEVYSNETWEWDGIAWTQSQATGPAARLNHAMVYDSARGVVVLFGGNAVTVPSAAGDTWEYDGHVWTQRAVAGPPGRYEHAMAYDSSRRVTVLFGGTHGYTEPRLSDTWEWDGATWTARSIINPGARYGHTMAFDEARGATVIYGGDGAHADAGYETWEFQAIQACPADLDDGTGGGTRDGAVTINDLLYFLSAFEAGTAAADLDNGTYSGTPDGAVTIYDLLFFLTHFESGC